MLCSEQCKAARGGLGWSRDELSEKSGVGKRTIIDFENKAREPINATKIALEITFKSAGVIFKEGMVCVPTFKTE